MEPLIGERIAMPESLAKLFERPVSCANLEPELRVEMMQLTRRRTVPQIYIGDTHVGGFDDLSALDREGGLDPLLNEQS